MSEQPDTELAVGTTMNPIIHVGSKDDKILIAFNLPTAGFILDERGATNLVKIIQKKLKAIKRRGDSKR